MFATPETCALSGILLPDSGHLQEEEASYANRKGFSKHSPALPLYTEDDARHCLRRLKPTSFDSPRELAPGVRATFRRAGHILGSAIVTLEIDARRRRTVTFSGDLGRPHHPVLCPPAPLPETDFLLVESTYGDRQHQDEAGFAEFESALVRTTERGGVCVIPAFGVDRTEVILYHLRRLTRAGRVPEVPVYVDSPMALDTLQIYRSAIARGSDEIDPGLAREAAAEDPFDPGRLIEARRVEDSMAINDDGGPAVIVSASGMATGGRVLHHLAHRLPDPKNCLILVGFQAEGTRGRLIADGARSIKMLGRYVAVRAEVVNVPAFSVHADSEEILGWLKTAPREPRTTFLVHGEAAAARSLEERIETELGWTAAVPRHLETVRLD